MEYKIFERVTIYEFDSIYKIMLNSFPVTEMRTYEGQLKLFDEDGYELYVCKDDKGNALAFIGSWTFDEFRFIEHFAVDKRLRGNGMGSKILKEYIGLSKKPIVLEVEPPENFISKIRIEFYKRLNFHMNEYYYEQLPLFKGGKNIELKMMTYPNAIDEKQFEYYKNIIYTNVYGCVCCD